MREDDYVTHRVVLIPGDGIGPEIAEAARRVLDATGVEFEWKVQEAGAEVLATRGTPLPESVLDAIREDQFWINPGSDDPLDARYAAMKARRNPDYFRNWNPTTGE